MSVEQKRRISNEQYDDMRLRYGTKSPVLSSLIIAKDEEGTIIGCVGLEQAIVGPPCPLPPPSPSSCPSAQCPLPSVLSSHPSILPHSFPQMFLSKWPCPPVHVAPQSRFAGSLGTPVPNIARQAAAAQPCMHPRLSMQR